MRSALFNQFVVAFTVLFWGAVFGLTHLPAQAQAVPNTIVGIHIRLEGTVHPGKPFWETMLKGRQEQCSGEIAKKLGIARPYSLSGDLNDTSRIETDEYYAPTLKMRARRITTYPVVEAPLCRFEVVKTVKWKIRHFGAKSFTDYEQVNDRKKGMHWTTTTHTMLDPKQTGLLFIDAMFSHATVSSVRGKQQYAGHTCEVSEVSLGAGINSTVCLLNTGTPFPGKVALATKAVSGGVVTLNESATMVSVQAAIPKTFFYPPKNEKTLDLGAASRSADNSTQKWCLAEKAKTGVNPCEEGTDD